jgi:glutamate--cysteine ligase
VGISKEHIRILDLLLIYCLITPSRKMTDKEKIKIEQQDINVIKSGRNPNLKVLFKNKEISISVARKELITDLEQLALKFKDQAFINAIKNVGKF